MAVAPPLPPGCGRQWRFELARNHIVNRRGSRISVRGGRQGIDESRVVVSYMGKKHLRNFIAPDPEICEVPGDYHLGKIIFESDHIYPVLNDLEVSRNAI